MAEAVDLGLGSVMYDASALDYAENVRATAEVVRRCHERGVWVEAEVHRLLAVLRATAASRPPASPREGASQLGSRGDRSRNGRKRTRH